MSERYQHQPWYIKAYRQVRYSSWLPSALYNIARWYFLSGKINLTEAIFFKSKWDYVKHIWGIYKSLGQYDMQHTFTMDEVFNNIKPIKKSVKRGVKKNVKKTNKSKRTTR